MGAKSVHAKNIGELKNAVAAASQHPGVSVIVIDTDPMHASPGGCWWEVEVPEVSVRDEVVDKRKAAVAARQEQRGY
jgi:3D-(3,5/4)-trihydroxycyclohexane-1,2-dione acylhydrolase (decyclizing)